MYAAGITHTAYLCFTEDTMESIEMMTEKDLSQLLFLIHGL